MEQKRWTVEKDGNRLDKWIAEQDKTLSRTAIARLLEEGKITVNGKKVKASYVVKQNDEVLVEVTQPKETPMKAEDIPIEIIYEDDNMLVVNKPKGLVVHPR